MSSTGGPSACPQVKVSSCSPTASLEVTAVADIGAHVFIAGRHPMGALGLAPGELLRPCTSVSHLAGGRIHVLGGKEGGFSVDHKSASAFV